MLEFSLILLVLGVCLVIWGFNLRFREREMELELDFRERKRELESEIRQREAAKPDPKNTRK